MEIIVSWWPKLLRPSPKSGESHLSFFVVFKIESERKSFFCSIVWLLRKVELYISLFPAVSKRICGTDIPQRSVSCLFAILCSFIFFEMKITEMPNEQLLMAYIQY